GGDALLEQGGLGVQRLELAPEERERLLGAASLPRGDHPLTLGGTHVDRAVGVYPAPRIVGGAHREPPARPDPGDEAGSGFLDDDPFYDDLLLGMTVTRAVGVVCARLGHIL